MKKFLIFLIISLLFVGCAEPAIVAKTVEPAGFWLGLWHGIIFPITFFLSLFMDSIAVYACNNTGGWYDFGFFLGIGGLFGGSR